MKKYDLLYKYTIGIFLIIYIGVMVAINLATPNKIFSETENRNLEQRPKFSFQKLFHGKFTKEFESYLTDQFAFRDMWIGVKSDCDRIVGKNESNGVYLSKDSYLIQTFDKPDEKAFHEKIDSVNSVLDDIPNANIYFMLVPNTVEILKNKLPSYAPHDSEKAIIDKTKGSINSKIKFIDITSTLKSKNNEYIFYKTDHHWTSKGAFYAYGELSKYMGFTAHNEDYFDVKNVTNNFYGSLSSKSGYKHLKADSISLYIPKENEKYKVEYVDEGRNTESLYNMSSLKKKDKYTVFFGGNHSLIKITTNNSSGKKLLIVKDSYANSLIPFLTGHYSEIYVVDPRYYEDDLSSVVNQNKISDVIMLYNVNTFFDSSSN